MRLTKREVKYLKDLCFKDRDLKYLEQNARFVYIYDKNNKRITHKKARKILDNWRMFIHCFSYALHHKGATTANNNLYFYYRR